MNTHTETHPTAQTLKWAKIDGIRTRSDGITLHALSVHEADRMCGGRVSHTGWRRVWACRSASGAYLTRYPGLVCGGSIAEAIEALAFYEKRYEKRAATP